ncbi:MAG: helix-turn-helix transcriptional regulator [Desulfovibrionaceae bacterium]|nr:helix-turn-helix transcriptional regulator [Desulfovibrionaceae bacterium]
MATLPFTTEVAGNIALRRKKAGLTQAQVAEKISVEKETVSRLESGKISLTVDRLQQLALIFGCSLTDLLNAPDASIEQQAKTLADMLRPLSVEEREAVMRFVGDVVRLFMSRRNA